MNPYEYAAIHVPRAGDRVRLGDSGLVIRVEDSQRHGDEFSGAVVSVEGAR
ncbi:hypothetical protein [Streptomyces sp. LUP47B]|uniref:hypothetical protein n=1 Tax=Streptomyces sp. LUP47B TaxID=1890286 RepID=UPI00099FDE42|nr:hypothetical protein [Streptomyces sp. LUP47B]